MPRKSSVVETVLKVLDPYLNERQKEFESAPEKSRKPTLPCKQEGAGYSVNLRQVAKDIAPKLAPKKWESIETYLKNKPDLKEAINLVAKEQGLQSVGERANKLLGHAAKSQQQRDQRLIDARREASASQQAAGNNALMVESLQVEIAGLENMLKERDLLIMRLQAELNAVREGHFFRLED